MAKLLLILRNTLLDVEPVFNHGNEIKIAIYDAYRRNF